MPSVKVFGFPFPDDVLDAWCDMVGLFPGMDQENRVTSAMQVIATATPWCGLDFSKLWVPVKGPPEQNYGMLTVFAIGSNETAHDLRHAQDSARVEIVRAIVGKLGIEPAWYWQDHSI